MKKLLSMMLTLVLVLGMSTAAFAADGDTPAAPSTEPGKATTATSTDASFSKTYKITNKGTSNPEETFTFTFTADHVTDSNANLTTAQMPLIAASTVKFDAGTATVTGLQKTVAVALSNVQWPGVGVYYYKVNETAGTTAGVTYDNATAYLKVTVAYNEGTSTYYTAFVTLSLADENVDGNTDVKTGGFTNVYSAGTLSITKKVDGNMGDQDAYFDVEVTLTGETGKIYLDSYSVTGGSNSDNPTTIKIGEKTTFKLKHNDTININNLPYGVTYTVTEADYTAADKGGYQAAKYEFSDTNDTKKIDTATETVTITNTKSTNVDMGIGLDSLPYILMLAIACAGLFVFISKKRMMREN